MRGHKTPIRAYRLEVKRVYVGRFESMSEAGAKLEIEVPDIRRVLIGERLTAGGHYFLPDKK